MVLVLRNDADTFRAESCCRVSWGAISYVENVKLNLAFTMWGQFVQWNKAIKIWKLRWGNSNH